jgi:hypothetical protein
VPEPSRRRRTPSVSVAARRPPQTREEIALLRVQRFAGNRAATQVATVAQQSASGALFLQRDDIMFFSPWIKDMLEKYQKSRPERVLNFLGKWGRNASPFTILSTYLRLNWGGIKFWNQVRQAAAKGKKLLAYVDRLEKGAQAMKQAVDQQKDAWVQLPSYPLETGDKAPSATVTQAELDHVERYYNTAAAIANDAMALRAEVGRAITGWDSVIDEANKTRNWTRKAVWESIIELELRFGGQGGFRSHLADVQQTAANIEEYCRQSQYMAGDIIGKWTPAGYQPPKHTP